MRKLSNKSTTFAEISHEKLTDHSTFQSGSISRSLFLTKSRDGKIGSSREKATTKKAQWRNENPLSFWISEQAAIPIFQIRWFYAQFDSFVIWRVNPRFNMIGWDMSLSACDTLSTMIENCENFRAQFQAFLVGNFFSFGSEVKCSIFIFSVLLVNMSVFFGTKEAYVGRVKISKIKFGAEYLIFSEAVTMRLEPRQIFLTRLFSLTLQHLLYPIYDWILYRWLG